MNKNPPPMLVMNESSIERVSSFKLLGLIITSTLKWDDHVAAICSKTASRMHFLKLIRRACINQEDALSFYTTVIRPILGICMPSMAQHADEEAVVHDRIAADTCDAYHIRWFEIWRRTCDCWDIYVTRQAREANTWLLPCNPTTV